MSNIQFESNGQAMILSCDYKKVLQKKIYTDEKDRGKKWVALRCRKVTSNER